MGVLLWEIHKHVAMSLELGYKKMLGELGCMVKEDKV